MKILVTGANGALAKETIKHLIRDGFRDITMAVRSGTRGESAKQEILKSVGSSQTAKLSIATGFDMNDPLQIIRGVKQLRENGPFDIIFLAAGFAVFADDYQQVEYNGRKVEKTVFQNLVGSHIVFNELKKNDLIARGARVVIAGGEGARGIKGMIEKPYFSSPQALRDYIYLNHDGPQKYNPMNAIGVSKFVGALWTKKVSELETDQMEVIWFSPGLTSGSAGLKNLSLGKRLVFGLTFRIMSLLGKSQTPERGGRKFADCLIGKVGKNGQLIGAPNEKTLGQYTEQTPLNTLFASTELKDELWDILNELIE